MHSIQIEIFQNLGEQKLRDSFASIEKRAIVVVSIGERTWLDLVLRNLDLYANACGADLIVHTSSPETDLKEISEMPDRPGRPNKIAYSCKTYFAWSALNDGYDRVAVFDDTCCVKPSAPDIFSEVPAGAFGFTKTSAEHAENSFNAIRNLVDNKTLSPIEYDTGLYMNSGVLVYDAAHLDALAPKKLINAKDLLFAKFPHQTLTYYLTRHARLETFRLNKAFNRMPGIELGKEARKSLSNISNLNFCDTHVFHVTSGYQHRYGLIEKLTNAMLEI